MGSLKNRKGGFCYLRLARQSKNSYTNFDMYGNKEINPFNEEKVIEKRSKLTGVKSMYLYRSLGSLALWTLSKSCPIEIYTF